MRCRILHESKGRMRVHIYKQYITGEQADILEEYLKRLLEALREGRHEARAAALQEELLCVERALARYGNHS